MQNIQKIILFLLCCLCIGSVGKVYSKNHIKWHPSLYQLSRGNSNEIIMTIAFDGAVFDKLPFDPLPSLIISSETLLKKGEQAEALLDSIEFRVANEYEARLLSEYKDIIPTNFTIQSSIVEYRHTYRMSATVFPIRLNIFTGKFELLTAFALHIAEGKTEETLGSTQTKANNSANNTSSKLSFGKTAKIGVSNNGIYKLAYEDLVRQGLISAPVASDKIALYGQKAGMLPTINTDVYDDLAEIPIQMEDRADGSFGPGDFFLFYGQSPTVWNYNSSKFIFEPQANSYSDLTFYFVGVDNPQKGARIETINSPSSGNSISLTSFPDYILHDVDLENVVNAGQTWYGESFSNNGDSKSFDFNLTDISQEALIPGEQNKNLNISIEGIANTQSGNSSLIFQTGNTSDTLNFRAAGNRDAPWVFSSANLLQKWENQALPLTLKYRKSGEALKANLNYISIVYQRNLNFGRGDLSFRHPASIDAKAAFKIKNTSSNLQVWNVSNPLSAYKIGNTSYENGTMQFIAGGDGNLHEFVAFDGSSYRTPSFIKLLDAKNLHALKPATYIVVHPSIFKEQATALGKLHEERNGYSTLVISLDDIYDEFGGGSPDPSAIRMFVKMLYDRAANANGNIPKYLTLFGKGTYDYKNRLGTNSNLVPCWEVIQPSNVEGGATDDLYAMLGDGEGLSTSPKSISIIVHGVPDIAIGRLPVKNVQEAKAMLEKIDLYSNPHYIKLTDNDGKQGNFGTWRNQISFVSDDGFEECFEGMSPPGPIFSQAILNNNPAMNVEKLYADAATQVSTAVNTSYPDINSGIKNRVNNGALFVGYLGHSGWDAWGDEKFLTINDINQWEPTLGFPMMFASSCSFALYDNPTKTSGAEETVLREGAGAISMIATTRSAYKGSIENIYRGFISGAVNKKDGIIPSIGDAFLYAKNLQGSSADIFVLLGDPGLKVALPKYEVRTLTINGKDADGEILTDTLKAFSKMEINGQIEDHSGKRIEGFNGQVDISIFDKISHENTLGQYNGRETSYNKKIPYDIQNTFLYKGSAEVKNGIFSFSFIVPKDIKYNYGFGKISYYAYSDSSGDANGAYEKLVVGGFNSNIEPDTTPPAVKLYLNKSNFLNGSEAGATPTLYAEISDNYGLNTTGVGLGHDMTLIIDGDYKNAIIVNDRFTYKTNSYTEGTLNYPLDISEGEHTIELKVWNIFNVSNTASLNFGVNKSDKFTVTDFRVSPNPATSESGFDFYFTHNGIGNISDYEIRIYNLQGGLVASFVGSESSSYGYSVGPISFGKFNATRGNLPNGIYIAKVIANNRQGDKSKKICKLIIVD